MTSEGENKHKYDTISLVYTRYAREILRFIHSKIQDKEEAYDILQNIFLSFIERRIPEILDTDHFRSYLFRCASNKISDYYRRLATAKLSFLQPEEITENSFICDLESMMISGEVLDTVHDAMRILDEEEGEIVFRKYYNNERKSKICNDTKISRYKLDKMLSKIILKVKENLPSYFSM